MKLNPVFRNERRPAGALFSLAFGAVVLWLVLAVACAPGRYAGRPASPAPRSPGTSLPATTSSTGGHVADSATLTTRGEAAGRLGPGTDRVAMIALAAGSNSVPVSSSGNWRISEEGGRAILVRGGGREPWRIEQRGDLLRVAGEGGDATPWRRGPFVARAETEGGVVAYEGKRYRGELWFTPTDSGILVVNRLNVEDYLRGVVPLELGTRSATDLAALEAQAIAARSYTYSRVPSTAGVDVPVRGFHMLATVTHQVYGGIEAEHPLVDSAIRATAGLVLRYNGVVVDAPYHSTCGGRTAAPDEVWQGQSAASYLRSVSDINEETGRPWCEISPRFHWSVDYDEARLTEVARRALAVLGRQPSRSPGIRSVTVSGTTSSGRVSGLEVETDLGRVMLTPGDLRNVFRDARGAILSSTYLTVDRVERGRGHLIGVTLRGTGNGHGVGMCQWGAIARARAGQNVQTILRHYYPGTVVGFAD